MNFEKPVYNVAEKDRQVSLAVVFLSDRITQNSVTVEVVTTEGSATGDYETHNNFNYLTITLQEMWIITLDHIL